MKIVQPIHLKAEQHTQVRFHLFYFLTNDKKDNGKEDSEMDMVNKNGQMVQNIKVIHIITLFVIDYLGEWRDNRAHGNGIFIHIDGDVYNGSWAYDKANGKGVYKHGNGAQYEGSWKDDLQHGKGIPSIKGEEFINV